MSLFNSPKDSRTIVIDSTDRFSGTPTNFTFVVDNLPRRPWTSVAVGYITIPRSWYDIGNQYNSFLYTEPTGNALITVPPGYYTVNTFLTEIQTLLNSASAGLGGYTWTVTYAALTNTYTFTQTGGAPLSPITFTFGPPESNVGYAGLALQMGFKYNSVVSETLGAGGGSMTSIHSIQIPYSNSLFLVSNVCNTAQSNILQSIMNVGQTQDLGFVYLENEFIDQHSREYTDPNSNYWTFTLQDQWGFPVNLNGLNFTFTLQVYIKSDTNELVKQDVLVNNLQRLEVDHEDNTISSDVKVAARENPRTIFPPLGEGLGKGNVRFAF